MHVNNRKLWGEQGLFVQGTLYTIKCRVSASLVTRTVDHGDKSASERLDGGRSLSNCCVENARRIVAKVRKCCIRQKHIVY